MLMYNIPNKVLLDFIQKEKEEKDYYYNADKEILNALLCEINKRTGFQLKYLTELTYCTTPGLGNIIMQYIRQFTSETTKAYLLHHLVMDTVQDCEKLLLQLYLHFRESDAYISAPGQPAPAHIYARYDSAFRRSKTKILKEDLLKLAHYPRDVVYLPFTMRKVASWKIPEIKDLLISYVAIDNICAQDVGLACDNDVFPPLKSMQRDLRFFALDAMKYYNSAETLEIVDKCTKDPDPDIRFVAERTYKKLMKDNQKTCQKSK